jgi:hypothetical protein
MPTRRGYAAAMRKRKTATTTASYVPAKKSAFRKGAEEVAKTVYKTASPTVNKVGNAVKKGTVKVLDGYLKGTQTLADKIGKYIPKGTPTRGTRGPRRRMTK